MLKNLLFLGDERYRNAMNQGRVNQNTLLQLNIITTVLKSFFYVFDLAVTSIADRYDQLGFKIYCNVEQLLFKVCSGED